MKIVLIGYMGSGKSSVGKLLAKKMNLNFVDLDLLIEQKEQLSINEIFNAKGEVYFRKKESYYLKDVLGYHQNLIIAVGGGTPCFGNNMEIINNVSTSVYLKASITTILDRVKNEKLSRPLIAHLSDENLPEFIGKHLFERTTFYNQSKIEILTDLKSIEEISSEIHDILSLNLNKQ